MVEEEEEAEVKEAEGEVAEEVKEEGEAEEEEEEHKVLQGRTPQSLLHPLSLPLSQVQPRLHQHRPQPLLLVSML